MFVYDYHMGRYIYVYSMFTMACYFTMAYTMFTMVYYIYYGILGLLWHTMFTMAYYVYYGILWYTMVYYCILWHTMVY